MAEIPKISETEWELMKVIWADAPIAAEQIIQALNKSGESWHPKTVKTLLNRLVKKQALAFEKKGRAYLYRPLVEEQECVTEVSQSFLEKVFGGSLKPMLAHFVEQKKLSDQEIQELKQILKKHK